MVDQAGVTELDAFALRLKERRRSEGQIPSTVGGSVQKGNSRAALPPSYGTVQDTRKTLAAGRCNVMSHTVPAVEENGVGEKSWGSGKGHCCWRTIVDGD